MTTQLDRQTAADNTLAATLGRFDDQADDWAGNVVRQVRAALYVKPSGTMRDWFSQRNGQRVTTIQVHNGTGTAWAPTGRTIDARGLSYVRLSGSQRDYRGMRVVATTDNVLIVADDWHTIAYIVEV